MTDVNIFDDIADSFYDILLEIIDDDDIDIETKIDFIRYVSKFVKLRKGDDEC